MSSFRSQPLEDRQQSDLNNKVNQGLQQIVHMYDVMLRDYRPSNEPLTKEEQDALRDRVISAMRSSA